MTMLLNANTQSMVDEAAPRRRWVSKTDYTSQAAEQFEMMAKGLKPSSPHGESKVVWVPDPKLSAEDRAWCAERGREIRDELAKGRVVRW